MLARAYLEAPRHRRSQAMYTKDMPGKGSCPQWLLVGVNSASAKAKGSLPFLAPLCCQFSIAGDHMTVAFSFTLKHTAWSQGILRGAVIHIPSWSIRQGSSPSTPSMETDSISCS